MKKSFILLGIFALLVIVCDFAVGAVGDKLVNNAKGGDTKRKNYIARGTNADILIFGSSRAIHHYDPDILQDTLGLTAYNCGFDGNGIICSYGFFKMITQRYYPKILIYEVTSGFDLLVGDNHKYLGNLRYFYNKRDGNSVDSIFWKVDCTERYKMFSKMYRFNSTIPQLIMDNLHPLHEDNKGYRPQDKEMTSDPKPVDVQDTYVYDSLKLYYLEKMINECKGKTQIIFAVSPLYENTDDRVNEPIKKLCDKYEIPLLSHYTDSTFNNRREYFYDRSHLNQTGATAYSKLISGEIKAIIQNRCHKNL
ncbi:MAG: hypothetical protein LUC91_01955 [Prevotella sp.]|nr:hypothetical protein [Prevotella sp.]